MGPKGRLGRPVGLVGIRQQIGGGSKTERKQADLSATQPYIILLTTPMTFNLGVRRRCDRQGPAGPVEAPDDGARRAESRATYCPTVNAIGLGVVEG